MSKKHKHHDDVERELENSAAGAPPAAGPPASGDGGAARADGDDALANDLARANAEVDRVLEETKILKQRLLEATADLDNQAKRFARERQVVRDEITVRVVRELLPVLDNLDLIEQSIPAQRRQETLEQGILLARLAFLDKLRGLGVEPMDAVGKPFDPFQHEAVTELERADVPPRTVVAEMTRGYRMGAVVVRAAKVAVSKAKE
jgi:molecular chaperone GrpE